MIIADGFSCREQIRQGSMRKALHLAEVLGLALHQREIAQTRDWPEREARALAPRNLVIRGGSANAISAAALLLLIAVLLWAIANLPLI